MKYFSTLEEKFRISACSCNILYISGVEICSFALINLHTLSLCSKMAITNRTADANQIAFFEKLYCSAEITGGIHSQVIFLLVFNILVSITAFLGNTLILASLHQESSLHPPSKLLLRNLATTDLCVATFVEPVTVIYWISMVNEQWRICFYTFTASFITGYILCSVSFLTLTAISVDRLLALLLGLRYRQVVTLKRTNVIIIVFWVVSIAGSTLSFWNKLSPSLYIYIGTTVCLITSIYSYTKIFLTLRHHQHQIQVNAQGQPSQEIPLSIARYRRTVSSALWVQLAMVFCYLPCNVMASLRNKQSEPSSAPYLGLELVIKSVSLLLEDQRSKTSGESHNQTNSVFV